MHRTAFLGFAAVLTLQAAGRLHGQPPEAEPAVDRPTVHVPLRPATREQLDHLEAVKLFGLAAIQEKQNRLVEAARTLEAARRLDPEAAAPVKALVLIYFALDRTEDALAGCRRVLELNPDDCEIAYLFSRKLRGRGEVKEARAVLERAAASGALQEHLELKAQICFDLGMLCEDAGDWTAAEKSLRRVIEVVNNPEVLMEQGAYTRDEIDARAAETYERLGRICLRTGQADRAIEAFTQAQKRDPLRAPRLSFNLAEVLVREGRPAEALGRLEEFLRSQPQGLEGYELKIKLQREVGRGGDVLPELEAAAGRDRHNTALQLLLAREYRSANEIDKARIVYDRLIREAPSPEAYQGLFDLFKKELRLGGASAVLGLLDDALAEAVEKDDKPGDANQAARARAMLQVLRGDPELLRGVLEAAGKRLQHGTRMTYTTRSLLGTLAARTRQLDVAEALYRDCLKRAGFQGEPRANEQEVYQGLLQVLQRAHKYEDVIQLCQEGLKGAQATNRVLFHLSLAEAHIALGHEREALAAVDDAVNESGERERMRCRLERAEVLSQAGKHEQATAECRALLKEYNQPGDVRTIRSVLSALYSAARQFDKAEEQLKRILDEDPNDAAANNDLGYQWADQNKNLDEAERRVRKALDLDREQRRTGTGLGIDGDADNAAYVDSLGWVLFRRGKWEQARKELERAAALPGGADDPVVWDHLGDVYRRLDLTTQAREAWRKAVAMYEAGHRPRNDGRYDEIKQKLRLLEP
jgi:tetratricopeptide (TPR) repeat protein